MQITLTQTTRDVYNIYQNGNLVDQVIRFRDDEESDYELEKRADFKFHSLISVLKSKDIFKPRTVKTVNI